VSAIIPLIKLIIDMGVFSPVAPTTVKGRKVTKGPAFGKLGLKRFF
jgi:hypothetical protein